MLYGGSQFCYILPMSLQETEIHGMNGFVGGYTMATQAVACVLLAILARFIER